MNIAQKAIYFFMGTTAEFIKLAPVMKELKKRNIKFKIILSGQSTISFSELKDFLGLIKADILLKEKYNQPSVFLFFIWFIRALIQGIFSLKKEFKDLNKNNSYFIIHGDTVSSTIGSLIAKFHGLNLVHIESGLRSYNFLEPFPEEICRYINMKLADILFCPNQWALDNIRNFKGQKINTKQNTLIETYLWAKNIRKNLSFLRKYKKYYILYIRRQEHIYFQREWIKKVIRLVSQNSDKKINCLFSINILNANLIPEDNIIKIPKLSYVDFMKLMMNAEYIATDGCTNQEEAYYMGLPLLALRNRTERIEGLGKNVVISKGDGGIIKGFLKNYKKYKVKSLKPEINPSKIIVDYLLSIK